MKTNLFTFNFNLRIFAIVLSYVVQILQYTRPEPGV